MLMGGGMIDQIGSVLGKEVFQSIPVSYGANEHGETQVGVIPAQFLLDVIGVVFVDVEDDELLRVLARDLTAELAADGAPVTRTVLPPTYLPIPVRSTCTGSRSSKSSISTLRIF